MKAVLFILPFALLFPKMRVDNDYRKIFGNDYSWAVNWLKQHDGAIQRTASKFGIAAKELKAIVFPELIRYNGLMNALEIESLKYLYVSEGKYYADFSVGYFQMKPSFAEMVEKDGGKLLDTERLSDIGWKNLAALPDDEDSRRARVRRLADINDQIVYLCVFYRICESRFRHRSFVSPEEKVRFYATCYNAGYQRSYETLKTLGAKNNFLKHNYASISAYYYLQE